MRCSGPFVCTPRVSAKEARVARAQAAGGQRMKENARVVVAFIHVRAGQGALGRALTPVPAL
jgi:hypothetical protein